MIDPRIEDFEWLVESGVWPGTAAGGSGPRPGVCRCLRVGLSTGILSSLVSPCPGSGVGFLRLRASRDAGSFCVS